MHSRPTQRRDVLRERVFAGRQQRTAQRRRAAAARKGGRRMVALFAGLAMVAGVLTVTQLASSALEDRQEGLGAGECQPEQVVEEESAAAQEPAAAGEEAPAEEAPAEDASAEEGAADAGDSAAPPETSTSDLEVHEEVDADGNVHYHYRKGRGGQPPPGEECEGEEGGSGGEDPGEGGEDPGNGGEDPGEGEGGEDPGEGDPGNGGENPGNGNGPGTVPPGGENGDNNGLEILGRDCTSSDLPLHTGFQSEQAQCINTQAGEVTALENNPSLLITEFPEWVEVGQPFSLTVSTRNLLRDRFLGAGAGGYYLEASYLTEDGIQRGHFHTACVNLQDGQVAPTPATLIEPQHFAAVEDGGGGAGVDVISVEIPGMPEAGLYRCTVWAGDPSHRIPMMSFAREQPPVDVVRIMVTEPGEQ